MSIWAGVEGSLGLTIFTILSVGLCVYLAYYMIRPQRF
jgi:hypothetical protein